MADRAQLERNPFFVLGLEPTCSRVEMEREGQKLLAMLEVGFADAANYASPFGRRDRTPELVRESMAILRDPDRRLHAELWARTPVTSPPERAATEAPASAVAADDAPAAWPNAMKAMGWK